MAEYEAEMYKDQRKNSVMQLRLDTDYLLRDIEFSLSGKQIKYEEVMSGNQMIRKEISIEIGRPKANREGIRGIMDWTKKHITTATVQGNLPKMDDLKWHMYYLRQDFNDSMFANQVNWGVEDYDYEMICDSLMDAIRLFLSRLLENKERESYTETLKSVESTTNRSELLDKTKQGFSIFR